METILDILNLSLPVATMLVGTLFTLLGIGVDLRGIKINNNIWKVVSLFLGVPTLLIGIISTFLLLYKVIFNASLQPPNFNTVLIAVGISGIIILAVIFVFLVVSNLRERGYKLDVAPVLDGEDRKREANIQVRNVGREQVYCHALLERVVLNRRKIDVNIFNPQGWYLQWDRKDQTLSEDYAVLTVGIPRVLYLVKSNGKDVYFEFQHNRKSQPIQYGTYSILIGFYRKKGKNFIPFNEFRRTLVVKPISYGHDVELRWLSDPVKKVRR